MSGRGDSPQGVVTFALLSTPRGLTRAALSRDTDLRHVQIELAIANLAEAGLLVERGATLEPSRALSTLDRLGLIAV